jgi:hypothetical protein
MRYYLYSGLFLQASVSKNKKTTYTSPLPFLTEGKPFGSGAMISAVLNLYPAGFQWVESARKVREYPMR